MNFLCVNLRKVAIIDSRGSKLCVRDNCRNCDTRLWIIFSRASKFNLTEYSWN